jgi:hypothetical protein
MDQGQAITAIVAGSTMITASFFIKKFFAMGGVGASSSGRVISTWKGRLLFWAVGGFMILVGLNYFLSDH